jgi:hypothetical protein
VERPGNSGTEKPKKEEEEVKPRVGGKTDTILSTRESWGGGQKDEIQIVLY